MKKLLRSLAVLVLLTAVISSCKKYPDGPLISLHTKKTRLSAVWALQTVKINGNDKTTDFAAAYPDYILRIDKIGNYFVYDKYDELDRGTWKFNEGKDFFTMTSIDNYNTAHTGYYTVVASIRELKNKELTYSYTDEAGDQYEMHFLVKTKKTGN